MDISRIKSALQFAIPVELYNIEPGQVAYFVPLEGLSQRDSICLRDFFVYLRKLHKDNDVKINIIPTRNELLIDTIAGRSPQEVGIPYKVVVSTWDTIAGFAAEYFGEDIEKIVERVPNMGVAAYPISISPTNQPAVVSINPEYRPVKNTIPITEESPDDFGMELFPQRPATKKEKEQKIVSQEDKIRKILWECAYLGIDIDVNGVVNEVETIKSQPTSGYQLSLKMRRTDAGLIDCKVFVTKDKELNLTAIQKAVYLTFLTLENGLVIEEAKPSFTKRIQAIYRLLPEKSQKEENQGGILYVDYLQPKTLRGYMSEINNEIKKLIPNGLVALEFAIEGEKDKAFKILRSTPEIRDKISSAFNL